MIKIVSINPFRCRTWSLHDRLEYNITDESCRDEIRSFERFGQLVPALGRPLHDDPECEVELICGARRLFVARHLNKPLLVELRQLSDQQAIIAMDIENRHRADLSPYERGLSYARWLREGYFKSQEEIAHALRAAPSQISRLLALSRLPAVVVNAFPSFRDICETWGPELMDRLDNSATRQRTVQRARAIAQMMPRPPAHAVYRQLLDESKSVQPARGRVSCSIVKDQTGVCLFSVKRLPTSVSFVFPHSTISRISLEKLQDALIRILQTSSFDITATSESQ